MAITLLRPPLRATLSLSRVTEAAVMMRPLPPPALIRPRTAARLHTEPSLLTPDTDSRLLLLQLLQGTAAIFNPVLFMISSAVLSSTKLKEPPCF